MTGKTHLAIGACALGVVCRVVGVSPDGLDLLLVLLGSLAPDLDVDANDNPNSGPLITRAGSFLRPFVGYGLSRILDEVLFVVQKMVSLVSQHRGVTHWPIFGLIIIGFAFLLESQPLAYFMVGYFSHIIADTFTCAGLPLFSPFSKQVISLTRLKTGSFAEIFVFWGAVLFAIIINWRFLPCATGMHQLSGSSSQEDAQSCRKDDGRSIGIDC